MKSELAVLRTVEFVGGLGCALLGLVIWAYLLTRDGLPENTIEFRTLSGAFLMVVLPGVGVAIGAYLHAIRKRPWAIILIVVGAAAGFIFVGLNAGFTFVYGLDKWGQIFVLMDLVAVSITLATAGANLAASLSDNGRNHRRVSSPH
ncbi:MAG TPA: hypothetical protein VFZ40_09930 [Pyrinomonadaceae bacterium]